MKKIILSILLIVYAIFSMTFMDDRDDVWTGIGLVFYLPCWLIIGLYYLRLIWRKNKGEWSRYAVSTTVAKNWYLQII